MNKIKKVLIKIFGHRNHIHAELFTISADYPKNTFGKFVEMTFDNGSRAIIMNDNIVFPLRNIKNLNSIENDAVWVPYNEISAMLFVAKERLGINIQETYMANFFEETHKKVD